MSQRTIAIIPVKKTSERVPNKNFKPFNSNGDSLLDITIKKLRDIEEIDHIYISSDKKDIKIKNKEKLSILERDEEYCNNITPWSDVISNIAETIPENDNSIIMWCHSTTPLFNSYGDALKKFFELPEDNYNSLVAVEKLKEFIIDEKGMPWNYSYGIWHKYSQDLPNLYKIIGSLFINRLGEMKKIRYVINSNPYLFQVDSKFGIDIDTQWQFELAQILYKEIYEKK